MEIVKAEILWTRNCPYKCVYCAMNTGERNSVSKSQWKQGVKQLKRLGCSFMAFYGAEPLYDRADMLAEVIGFAEKKGIHTTLITNGEPTNTPATLTNMLSKGLRSLTMSYDIVYPDKYTARKAKNAVLYLDFFGRMADKMGITLRDRATVTTLTAKNVLRFPDLVRDNTGKGIWSLFDIVHPDRGQPGSKCKNYQGIEELLFTSEEDIKSLAYTLNDLSNMKREGYLLHTSENFISHIDSKFGKYMETGEWNLYDWNCSNDNCFPSWVTVNCDGTVYPCDDFQMDLAWADIKVWEIYDRWHSFGEKWRPIITRKCPGCCWNTHMDAHWIKRGLIPMSDYVHTR